MASTKTLERLELIFTANQEQFTKQLDAIENSLAGVSAKTDVISTKMGAGLTSSMVKAQVVAQVVMKVFEKLGQALVYVVGKVIDLGKQLMTSGSQLVRMRIATNTVARNMGIASTEVDKLRVSLGEANTYGIKAEQVINSLARNGLFKMAEGLSSVDARTGSTVNGISALVLEMKDLGAVAGISSSDAINQLTQFINQGESATVNSMIAIGNLGKVYDEYAVSIGKTRAQLSGQEEAEARLLLVHNESKKAFGAYAESYTTSGKMMASIGDALTSSFEELGAVLEPIWASITTAVLQFVQNVRNFINQNGEVIKQWALKVSGWVVYVIQTLANMMSRIPVFGTIFESLKSMTVKTAKSGEAMADSTNKESDAMKEATGGAKALKKELTGLAGFDEMNVLKAPESSGGGGGGASATAPTGPGIFGNFGAEVDAVIEGIRKSIEEKFAPIKDKLAEFFKPFVWAWDNIMKPAVELFQKIWGDLMDRLANSEVIKGIGQALQIVAVIIGAVLVVAVGLVIGVIIGLIDILDFVAKAIGYVVGSIIGFFMTLGESIAMIWLAIKNKAIEVWNAVSKFFSDGIKGLILMWDLLGLAFKIVWDKLKQGATDAWEGIKNIFGGIANWFRDVFTNAWTAVKNVFSAGGQIFESITDGISSVFKTVVNGIIGGINTVISVPFNAINTMLGKLRALSIAGISPFTWLPTLNVPQIPKLAKGGVVNSPTYAMLGEAGREAIVPLENTAWMKELAGMINQNGGGSINLTVQVGDEKIATKVIDYINDKAIRGGGLVLNI